MFKCQYCGSKFISQAFADSHTCEDIKLFRTWLRDSLEDAVDAFRQSDLFKFEIFYNTWRNTHKQL